MHPFSAAIDVLFANPDLAIDAVYTPAGGDPVTVRAVLARPDKEIDLGLSGLQAPSWTADVRASELPAEAARRDSLEIAGDTFIVRRITLDALRLIATLDLDPA